MSNYIFPFLVNQNIGVLLTMKRSALLALDNLVVTIILSVAVLIVAVLSVILAAPVLLLMLGIIAFLQNVGYHELMQKYDDAPSQETTVETTIEGEVWRTLPCRISHYGAAFLVITGSQLQSFLREASFCGSSCTFTD